MTVQLSCRAVRIENKLGKATSLESCKSSTKVMEPHPYCVRVSRLTDNRQLQIRDPESAFFF